LAKKSSQNAEMFKQVKKIRQDPNFGRMSLDSEGFDKIQNSGFSTKMNVEMKQEIQKENSTLTRGVKSP